MGVVLFNKSNMVNYKMVCVPTIKHPPNTLKTRGNVWYVYKKVDELGR